ncbi:hypothetical protein ABW19_dt0201181 [Dactylella cylindrospora]|nr:hypothetical protein ABW19_dt0201181 [Dactylella cylindrospora]
MTSRGTKRPFSGGGGNANRGGKPPHSHSHHGHSHSKGGAGENQQPTPTGPYISMFSSFRNELDEHHDRRERIIKASRDVTAASKKIIFTLQRLRPSHLPIKSLPPYIVEEIVAQEAKIQGLLAGVLPDLQGINGWRYQRQISPGIQEYVEALSFRHYLMKGELLGFGEAGWFVSGVHGGEVGGRWGGSDKTAEGKKDGLEGKGDAEGGGEGGDVEMKDVEGAEGEGVTVGEGEEKEREKEKLKGIKLTKEDYILALFDLTGEMMRFAITSIATTPLSQLLSTTLTLAPTIDTATSTDDKKNAQVAQQPTAHRLLQGLREMRLEFENLDAGNPRAGFGKDVEKKAEVMRECVGKVEYGFYGMMVRGSERPEGWVADMDSAAREGGED